MSSAPVTSACTPPRSRCPGAPCLITMLIVALCRNGPARCAEQAPVKFPMAPMLSTPSLPPAVLPSVPPSFTLLDAPLIEEHRFSDTDFSPRKRGMLGNLAPAAAGEREIPRLGTITVWQRLNQFRSRDRVRVVTLWEFAGSSVSLQAGRKGNPSLQWTSKLMNRGGSTRGLLDKIVAAAVTGAGATLRGGAVHGTGMPTPGLRPGPAISSGGRIP